MDTSNFTQKDLRDMFNVKLNNNAEEVVQRILKGVELIGVRIDGVTRDTVLITVPKSAVECLQRNPPKGAKNVQFTAVDIALQLKKALYKATCREIRVKYKEVESL